jgi:hypothetical protein
MSLAGMRQRRYELTFMRYLSLLILTLSLQAIAQDPVGFKVDRYKHLWERNPFTLVTPVVTQAQPGAFDKFVLESWTKEGAADAILVQNTENNEVQKITSKPNQNHLRLIRLDLNPRENPNTNGPTIDPKHVEAIISDGSTQGSVHFKIDSEGSANGENATTLPGQEPQPGGMPSTPYATPYPNPATQHHLSVPSNSSGMPGIAPQQQPPPGASANYNQRVSRAAEIRRKRILPAPSNPQPVNP